MVKKTLSFITHLAVFTVLTAITQIGGLAWILGHSIINIAKARVTTIWAKVTIVVVIYLFLSLVIVPYLAKINGRVPLPWNSTSGLKPYHWSTVLLNRHYVHPDLKEHLISTANQIGSKYEGIGVHYLDANFPFFNEFPLLPHLSHDDGNKVDLSFIYRHQGELSNNGPSRSGYGAFTSPTSSEAHQIEHCLEQGYWQYDFTKYLTFGSRNGYNLDLKSTKSLILELLDHPNAQMLFVEPHLKDRMNLMHPLVRYHGCQAVRHDDHIHFQMALKPH